MIFQEVVECLWNLNSKSFLSARSNCEFYYAVLSAEKYGNEKTDYRISNDANGWANIWVLS